jgi:hypothetical protein
MYEISAIYFNVLYSLMAVLIKVDIYCDIKFVNYI